MSYPWTPRPGGRGCDSNVLQRARGLLCWGHMRSLRSFIPVLTAAALAACTGEIGPGGGSGGGGGGDDDTGGALNPTTALVFDSPARGAMIDRGAGPKVVVSGHSIPGEDLEINGQPVTVAADGAFSIEIDARDGVNVIEAEVSTSPKLQAARSFIYGDFLPAGELVESGILLRINKSGIDDGDDEVDDLARMAEVGMRAQMPELRRRIDEMHGSASGANWEVIEVNVGTPTVTLAPRDGGMHAVIHLPDPNIRIRAEKGCLFTTCTVTARIRANDAIVNANVGMGLNGEALEVAITGLELDMPGFDTSIDGALGGVFEGIIGVIVGNVDNLVRDAIRDGVRSAIPEAFDVGLSSLQVPTTLEIPQIGLVLALHQRFDRVAFNNEGGEIGLGLGAEATFAPGAPGEGTPGSLRLDMGLPALSLDPEFGLSVSLDLLNQLLYAGWGQGKVVIDVPEGSIDSPGPAIGAVHATLMAPPVVVPAEDGSITIAVGDVILDTTIDGVPSKIAISARSRAHVEFDKDTNGGRFVLDGTPTLQAELIEGPEGLISTLLITFLESNVPAMLRDALGAMTFPLPELPLDGIGMGEILRINEPQIEVGDHITFYGRLVAQE